MGFDTVENAKQEDRPLHVLDRRKSAPPPDETGFGPSGQQRVEVPHLPRGADAVEVQAATTRQHGVGDGDLEEAAEIEHMQRRSAEHLVRPAIRPEEHTPELQSLMRISYAVFRL